MKRTLLQILIVLVISWQALAEDDEPATDLHGDPLPRHAVGRLGTVRFLPQAASVSDVAWSPDGKRLATLASVFIGSVDPGIQIWDPNSGREIGPDVLVHRNVHAMAWSPDSRHLAVTPDAGDVEIWDVVKHEQIRVISGDGETFQSLCWSPDGKWIAAGDKTKAVTVFDAATGNTVRSLNLAAKCVDFSSDSKRLAAGRDHRFRIWDVETGQLRQQFKVKDKSTYSVRFAPDDQSLVVTGNSTWLVDLSNKKPQVEELTDEGGGKISSFCASFNSDGSRLLTVGFSHARLWDSRAKKVLLDLKEQQGFTGAFTPGGNRLVFNNRRLTFVDANTGVEQDPFPAHARTGLGMALTSDGKTAYTVNAGPTIRKWDVGSTRQTGELTLPTGSARAVAVSHDGTTLAVAEGKSVYLFDTKTGRVLGEPDVHEGFVSSVNFSPAGNVLVSCSSDGKVRFRNSSTGKTVATKDLGIPGNYMGFSVFSGDGRLLALVSPDHSKIELVDPATRKRIRTIRIHEAMVSLFLPVCFLPEWKGLAMLNVSIDPDDDIWVHYHIDLQDVASGVLRRRLKGTFEYPSAIACPPQGDVIAVADHEESPRKHVVGIYSTKTGKRLAQFDGHVDRIRQLTFSPDGNRLFSTSQDTTTLIWSLKEVRASLAAKSGS